ncbi:hypothetical protein FNV43_RR07070 [Rhamnella rubrinervis]|uniref:Uncharacterized protein n=1 Tax=Rhamnella rubrinervis TaxID=2594499 RepID=A0A8K0MLV3_9ROSA|nr:hypothetical protein FNV43_RR07070 [Rhamnella rubrinervis]
MAESRLVLVLGRHGWNHARLMMRISVVARKRNGIELQRIPYQNIKVIDRSNRICDEDLSLLLDVGTGLCVEELCNQLNGVLPLLADVVKHGVEAFSGHSLADHRKRLVLGFTFCLPLPIGFVKASELSIYGTVSSPSS